MADIHAISDKMIDYATRLSDVADAAQGKRRPRGGVVRWTLLPASGAALLALVRSDFFARQAKEVVNDAKSFASDLPDDLMTVVRETASSGSKTHASQSSRSGSNRAPATPARKTAARKASSSRKRTSTPRRRTSTSR